MNIITKLKHWQAFLILITAITLSNFTFEGNPALTTAVKLTGVVIYFSWPLLAGHALYQLLPAKIEFNYNFFLFNSFIWLAGSNVASVLATDEAITLSGLAALPGFYLLYAYLSYQMFTARVLKSIEKKEKASVGDCIGDFFLILLLPIGIWFLQQRINKAASISTPE